MKKLELAPHPRLCYMPDDVQRDAVLDKQSRRRESEHSGEAVPRPYGPPWLAAMAETVKSQATVYARVPALSYSRNTHNEHLLRAREVQTRVMTLLVRWAQTGDERFRQAIVQHVQMMAEWEYWSWITWRRGDPAPDAIFDLSYGENSTTLAFAYDWLYDTLSAGERALFIEEARRRPLAAAVRFARPKAAWWFGLPDSNWNAVCAGGLGLLALAMYDDAPEARRVLPFCEQAMVPFMRYTDSTDGGWPEGLGYWNYGMRYAFLYLLSHEAATGKRHPLLALKGVRKTLSFPLDFCPNGAACGFGDANSWSPLPFHYVAAQRLRQSDVCAALDAVMTQCAPRASSWPDAAEWLAVNPRPEGSKVEGARHTAKKESAVAKLYGGLGWAILADRLPSPRLYVSVRGGTTKVHHGHLDLLSFYCVVGREKMIDNAGCGAYLDTTFSPRRWDIFEMRPDSKNTILINGVGIPPDSALDTTALVRTPCGPGVYLDATSAMGISREGAAAKFCARLFVLLDVGALLILDRIVLPHVGRGETRMHTPARVRTFKAGAALKGTGESLRAAFASDVPAVLRTAVTAPTHPQSRALTMLRWISETLHEEMTFATLLAPGTGSARVTLSHEGRAIVVRAAGKGWRRELRLSECLWP